MPTQKAKSKSQPALKPRPKKRSAGTRAGNPQPAQSGARDELRFVLSEQGHFVFATPHFIDLLGIGRDPIGLNAGDVMQIVQQDSEGQDDDRDFLSLFQEVPPHGAGRAKAGFKSGSHTLILGPDERRLDFQFDWVSGPDGKSYMVASADTAPGLPQHQGDMRRLIGRIVDNVANKPMKETEFSASASLRPDELRQLFDMSDDLMCTLHMDGDIIHFNPAFAEILGYEPQQMIGKIFLDFIEPADRAAMRAALFGMSQFDGVPPVVRMECRMLTHAGDERQVLWMVTLSSNVFYCLGRDITDSKAREEELVRGQQRLSEAQALAHMGHWRWEVGASDIEWSDELYNIFGVTPDDFTPAMDSISALIHRRDLGRLFQAFQRAIIQQNDYDMDFRAIRPDGQVRTIRCEGRCELDDEGEVVALYGVMQDVTPQKEHEKALRDAKEQAEAAYASKSRFLANMSHELRTPLNAIIGFSDLIQKQLLGPIGNERYLDYINSIRESGHHLLDLITDILDMSKIEAGKYELTLEDIDLSQILRTVTQMMEARAQEGGLTLRCTLPDDDVSIRGDRRAIKQILLNLLSNAIKFTRQGGTVEVLLTTTPGEVRIDVRDSGIGIPAHKLADVTKPFEQVSNAFTRGHEGSGLGLAITKDLTELHGGTLAIDSRLGVGTTVTIRLPRD